MPNNGGGNTITYQNTETADKLLTPFIYGRVDNMILENSNLEIASNNDAPMCDNLTVGGGFWQKCISASFSVDYSALNLLGCNERQFICTHNCDGLFKFADSYCCDGSRIDCVVGNEGGIRLAVPKESGRIMQNS